MKLRFVLALLFVCIAALSVTPALAGGPYNNVACANDGGTWSGPQTITGTCTFAANSSPAIAACGTDNDYEVTYSTGYSTGSTCTPVAAGPTTSEADCTGAGGGWRGPDSDNGTCTFAAGSSTAVTFCGANYEYSLDYTAGSATSAICTYVAPTESDEDTRDEDGGGVNGPADTPVTLALGGGNNGSATFSPDACPQKCTIT